MLLRDLEASFIGEFKSYQKGHEKVYEFTHLTSIDRAQGIIFICPKCGKHSILIWFKNPFIVPTVDPKDTEGNKSRWLFSGNNIDNLSLTPSIDLSQINETNPASDQRCYWHGFVTNGKAE